MGVVMNITGLFGCITEISLRASCIAAGILAIRLLAKKMPGKYGCMLWMAAFLAFLIPASARITCTVPMTVQSKAPAGQNEGLEGTAREDAKDTAREDAKDTAGEDAKDTAREDAQDTAQDAAMDTARREKDFVKTDAYRRLLAAVWAAGAVILLMWQAYRYWHLKRILSVSVRKSGNVYISDKVDSPVLLGILAPNIYLPAGMDEKTAYFAVLHEQMHQRRKDYFVKFAAFLICACYWWNPLIWLMYRLFGKDMERACDEAVLGCSDVCGTAYAQALLDTVRRSRCPAFGLRFAAGTTRSRVKHILNFQKGADQRRVRYMLLVLFVSAVCVTQPEVRVSGAKEKTMTEVWDEIASEYPDLPEYKVFENRDENFRERQGYMRVQIIPAVDWDEIWMKINRVEEKFLNQYKEVDAVVCGWKSPVNPEIYPIDNRCSFGVSVHYRNKYATRNDTEQEESSAADGQDKPDVPEQLWEDRIGEYTGFPAYFVYRDYDPYEKEEKEGLLFIRVFGTYNWNMSKDFLKTWKEPVTEIAGQIIEQFEEIKEVHVCWDEMTGKKGQTGYGVKPAGIIQTAEK